MRSTAKIRALLGVLAVMLLVVSAAGCGTFSDQARQEARQKVEDKKQQAEQKIKKKVQTGQEDLKKKVDSVQKDVNDLQKKVDELLKKLDAKGKHKQ